MSFDINLGKNLSNVQASSKTSDGGAGNTGYFGRQANDEDKLLGFKKDYPNDSFEKIEIPKAEEEDKSILELIKELILSIFQFIKELFSIN